MPRIGGGGRLMGVPEKYRAWKGGTAQPLWGRFSALGEGEAEKLLLEAQGLKPEPRRLELAWPDCVLGRGKPCQTNFPSRGAGSRNQDILKMGKWLQSLGGAGGSLPPKEAP